MEKEKIASFKNYKSDEQIKNIYNNVFNKNAKDLIISKLSGGMKNTVYLISTEESKVVLKVAPKDETKMISADRNTLWWEAEMLKLMNTISFPSPKYIFYDDSCTICESPYLFMSYIPGFNYLEKKDSLDKHTIADIEYEIGTLRKKYQQF